MTLSKDQIIAFMYFLIEERARHAHDIEVIEGKLNILRQQGIVPQGTAPWIDTDKLVEACNNV